MIKKIVCSEYINRKRYDDMQVKNFTKKIKIWTKYDNAKNSTACRHIKEQIPTNTDNSL